MSLTTRFKDAKEIVPWVNFNRVDWVSAVVSPLDGGSEFVSEGSALQKERNRIKQVHILTINK